MFSQHVIDPSTCIACEICMHMCPSGAISEIDATLVVDPHRCDGSASCLGVCPTGSIAHWLPVPHGAPYSIEQQATWADLPGVRTGPAGLGR